jgi:GTPase SAR1 family protein
VRSLEDHEKVTPLYGQLSRIEYLQEENMQNDSTIIRSALGCMSGIGDLYDARRDAFVGVNIFNQSPSETCIFCRDNPSSKVDFEITDRLSEKFRKLNVDAELQLSVLAGLVSLKGSGSYLSEEKSSAKSARMSLLYSITTKSESINILNSSLKGLVDLNAINCVEATHVVVGIDWGANCTITSEYANQENEERTKVEGFLKVVMNKIACSITGKGDISYEGKSNEHTQNFSFHSNCDIVTTDEDLPSTLQQSIEFVKKLPRLIKEANNGKGKPLYYTLFPVSSVMKYFDFERQIDVTLKRLREESILRFVHLFEEISSVRQELHDLYRDMQSNMFCLPNQDVQAVANLKNDFAIAESNLKTELNQVLVEVRSAKVSESQLGILIQEFEGNEFSVVKIQDYFQSLSSLREKIHHVNILASKGINYIGKTGSLEDEFLSSKNREIYVLFSTWSNRNSKLWRENIQLFMSLLKTHSGAGDQYKFIVVDCDLNSKYKDKSETIAHYVDSRCRCEDVLQMNKVDASLCFAQSNSIEDCIYPSNSRAEIKLRCPGSLSGGGCENSIHQWLCNKCRRPLEYGFDEYFYCSCGRGKSASFQYRCSSKEHGSAFMSYPEEQLNNYLAVMKPLEEINILILGETGVGKSTWINAFANYIVCENLAEAEKEDLICVIPSSFTMADENFEEKQIKIGEDTNESSELGQSATQDPRAYRLSYGDKIIRLIDTPGIGDTRGIEQDQRNVEKILAFLSHYEEIHGICILLKPNNARLGVMFRFCIKELLTHLHRDAAHNIVFCFTNARNTFYKPGDTLPALRQLLQENPEVEIALSKQTMYFMDNEAFRFLAALKSNIEFDQTDRQDYSTSWDRSVQETTRLLKHITSLKPHKTKDTLTLNDARRIIVNLTKPIAEISQNIQANIARLEEHKQEIESSKESVEALKEKLYIPAIDLERKQLDYPRTVCTSTSCTETVVGQNGEKKVNYKTHCHERCYLDGVQTDVFNNVALQGCSAMNSNNYCRVCGCSWDKHMHVTYELSPVETRVVDLSIEIQIKSKEDAQRATQQIIQDTDLRVKKFKQEQEFITKASAKFACFLKQNAIAPYNDALAAYLSHLIIAEEKKVNPGDTSKTLEGLQEMKRAYDEQVKILDNAMEQGESQAKITPDDIKKLEDELLNLELKGANLRGIITTASQAQNGIISYFEHQLQTQRRSKDGWLFDVTDAFAKKANKILDMLMQ